VKNIEKMENKNFNLLKIGTNRFSLLPVLMHNTYHLGIIIINHGHSER